MTTEDNYIVAEGRHPAICRSIQFGKAGTGNVQIAIGFEIVDEGSPDNGSNITYFGSFSDAAIEFTVQALRNCGWTGDDLVELPALADSGGLAETVSLVVAHEEYDGKLQAKVKWVNKPGSGRVKLKDPLDEGGIRNFAMQMRGKINAVSGQRRAKPSGGSGGARSGQHHPNAPGNSDPDNDIPFASASIDAEPSAIARVLR